MKAQLILTGLALIAGLQSCRPGNEASTASAPEKKKKTEQMNDSGSQTGNSRLIVSFISIGEGTDFKAKDSMDVFLRNYEQASGKAVKFEAVPWGREGEVDYCFVLNELSEKEQKKFVADIRSRLSFSQLVQISENQPCRLRR